MHREQRRPAVARNEIWGMDFVADQLADGRRFRALTVIDLFIRECLAIDVGHGLSGRDVVTTLERLRFERGLPQRIHCDDGSEFVSAEERLEMEGAEPWYIMYQGPVRSASVPRPENHGQASSKSA